MIEETNECRIIQSIDDLLSNFENINTSDFSNLLLKIVIFLHEIIRRESRFKSFVAKLREGDHSIIEKTILLILKVNQSDETFLLSAIETFAKDEEITSQDA